MKFTNYTTILIIVLLSLSLLPYQASSQEEETRENAINSIISPKLDGFIDANSRTGYVSEWGDGIRSSINLRGVETERTGDMITKWVSDTLYIGFTSAQDFRGIYLQVDFNHDGTLSQHDIMIAAIKSTEESKALSFNQESQTPVVSDPILGLFIYDGEGTWVAIHEFLGIDKNKNYDSFIETLVADIAIQNNQRYTKQRVTEYNAEIMFSPNLLIQTLVEYGANINAEEFEIKDSIDYGLIILDENFEVYGYPQAIENSQNFNGLIEYVSSPIISDIVFAFQTDIGIDHIEVTQAVQFEDNSLPLVRGKRTLARVFVNNPTGGTILVDVTLYGYAFALLFIKPLGSLSTSFNAPASPNRNNFGDSANFELPGSWEDTVYLILKAKVNRIGYVDTNPADNEKAEMFNFQETYDMNIYYVRLNSGTATSPTQISTATFQNLRNIFRASYPMANPNFIQLGWQTAGIISTSDDHGSIAALNNVLGSIYLSIILEILFTGSSSIPLPDQIVGFRTGGGGHSDPKWNNHGAKLAYATVIGNGLTTLGHEINHNLGPNDWGRHVAGPGYGCSAPGADATWSATFTDGNIHALGWLPGTGLIPANTVDFMTYCSSPTTPNAWVSDYRWNRLFSKFQSFTPGSPALELMKSQFELDQALPTSRFISGVVDPNDGLTLDPSFELEGDFSFDPIIEENISPVYYLNIYYADGTSTYYPIYNEPNTVTLHDGHEETSEVRSFSFWVPDNGQITHYSITDPNQNLLYDVYGTGFTGTAALNIPSAASRGGVTTIDWDYSLSNQTNIYAQLQYSNEKNVWYNIGERTLSNSVEVNFDDYPGSTQGKFRLILTDGFDTRIVTDQTLMALANLHPTVEITANTDVPEAVFDGSGVSTDQAERTIAELNGFRGSTFSLGASGYDPEDGVLPDTSYKWSIFDDSGSLVGQSQTGKNITFNLVEDGAYRVEVSVTDSVGQIAIDEIKIVISSVDYVSEERLLEFFKENGIRGEEPLHSSSSSSDKESEAGLPIPLPITPVLIAIAIVPIIKETKRRK